MAQAAEACGCLRSASANQLLRYDCTCSRSGAGRGASRGRRDPTAWNTWPASAVGWRRPVTSGGSRGRSAFRTIPEWIPARNGCGRPSRWSGSSWSADRGAPHTPLKTACQRCADWRKCVDWWTRPWSTASNSDRSPEQKEKKKKRIRRRMTLICKVTRYCLINCDKTLQTKNVFTLDHCKSRIFRIHVIFVYSVRGGFRTKIKCIRKVRSKWKNPQQSTAVRKFRVYERLVVPSIRKFSAYEIFWIYSTLSLSSHEFCLSSLSRCKTFSFQSIKQNKKKIRHFSRTRSLWEDRCKRFRKDGWKGATF